jgi:SagB-type dehydrogenase family enzyme
MKKITVLLIVFFIIFQVSAQEKIMLPAPDKTGGMPLMEALSKRSTTRSFSTKEISQKQLSNVIWAAFGINRPDGKRTAPSTRNFQGTDLYVLLKSGAYKYEPKEHQLIQVTKKDLRAVGSSQAFVKDAPAQIILVSDLTKCGNGSNEDKINISNIDAGYISQNIYLSCASEGLATGARGSIDRKLITSELQLKETQFIVIAHCVGYSK